METAAESNHILALYADLTGAEAALHALQAAGAPYPAIRMGAHTANELGGSALRAPANTSQFWSLAVLLEPAWREQALATLRASQAFALGQPDAIGTPANESERGALAWRHYVFESQAASDQTGQAGDGAGTTGTTGVISSGVFADGALAEGNSPTKATPASDERASDEGQPPSSDTHRSEVGTSRSRPQTELHEP